MTQEKQIFIRDVIPADRPDINRINADGWEYAYRGIISDGLLDTMLEKIRNYTPRLAGKTSAENDYKIALVSTNSAGKITGFAIGGLGRSQTISETNDVWILDALYVDPNVIGTGIGRKLFSEWARRAITAGAEKFIIRCASANKSCGFYDKIGCKRIAETTDPNFENKPVTFFEFDLKDFK
ncbi:MAG: GNAT family N-acetyltransferase [Alphaproteobacteria bacterium]|nr:GNAT family N-acetyltransferase [Alphaproteobacteria bacterium]